MDQYATCCGGRPQSSRHCVRWGPSCCLPLLPARRGVQQPAEFSAHVCFGQTAGWIETSLGMEVGFGLAHCVRWGLKHTQPQGAQPPIFGLCLLWPNGWMDQCATWYGGRPRPRPHCIRWGPSSPRRTGHSSPPLFGRCLVTKRSPISATAEHLLTLDCVVLLFV